MKELDKVYDPHKFEDKWYSYWEKHQLFHAKVKSDKKPYTIVIPPPNITGILTMGHVLNNTIQDLLIRWHRMKGNEACWIPGTDHAGIATQTVVEKHLAKDGISRHDIGREKFVEKVWEWREKYGRIIIQQLKKLGTSCDWERESFTMSDSLSKAVKEVFVRLFDKGLIYKGERIVNWCPKSRSAISDEEVVHKEINGKLWYFRYPVKNSSEYVIIATTRPETMLGDTAVAVNPDDERYQHLKGKTIVLPLVKREIPIIEDEYVDKEFGTGCVKITPAHDPNDFEVGNRNNLPLINIMNEDGTLNDRAGEKYKGMDRFEARKVVLKNLEELGLIEKIEDYTHQVGYSDRGNVPIEPLLSKQWFIKMKPLAEPALKVVKEGKVKFHPEHWIKTYNHWMENIKDWCISRQLWWGHRIPVWYCDETGEVFATTDEQPTASPSGNPNIHQDEDVLDTWASSWLWPFSILNWPDDNPDLNYFYPTNTLVTAPDIIFFWVARMIMAGLEFMGDIPFEDVYFTGLIRDEKGRKLSKSLGNSPDPLEVIDSYGADAVRFTMTYLTPLGQDIYYSNDKCEIGRNFANKIWNAGRFLMMNVEQHGIIKNDIKYIEHSDHIADKWILSSYHSTIKAVENSIKTFKFIDGIKSLYDFIWKDFCDWYIEITKIRLINKKTDDVGKEILSGTMGLFENILKLLHPFMPFITEELWQSISERKNGDSIMVERLPDLNDRYIDDVSLSTMEKIQEVITAIRNIRAEYNIPPSKNADVMIKSDENMFEDNKELIKTLAKVKNITLGKDIEKPELSSSSVVKGIEIYVPLEGLVDIEKERQRIEKELKAARTNLEKTVNKLSNEKFINRAPENVIEKEKEKKKLFEENVNKLEENLARLS